MACTVAVGCGNTPPLAPGAPWQVQPVLPRSMGVVASPRPLFRWTTARGSTPAQVTVCTDPGCTHPVAVLPGAGNAARPARPLPPGVLFWTVTPTGTPPGAMDTPWELVVPHGSAPSDGARGTVLDVNRDGRADAVTVAPALGDPLHAVVSLVWGSTAVITPTSGPPDVTVTLPLSPDSHALRATAVGDVQGDGFADVVVQGLVQAGSTVQGTLLRGSPAGLSVARTDLPVTQFAGAGDLDLDGHADALGVDDLGPALFLGPATVFSTPVRVPVDASYTLAGRTVASLAGRPGDFNGDGMMDMALVPGDSDVINVHAGHPDGTLPDLTRPTVIRHVRGAANFDSELTAAADVDGDGMEDLVVAPPSAGPREVLTFLGGSAGLNTTASTTVTLPLRAGASAGAESVVFVTGAGDLDEDGRADVAFLLATTGSPDRAVVLRGSPAGLVIQPLLDFMAGDLDGVQVTDVTGVGDMDGDGVDDLLLLIHPATGPDRLVLQPGATGHPRTLAVLTRSDPAEATHGLVHGQ